jgi:hypothetical protein
LLKITAIDFMLHSWDKYLFVGPKKYFWEEIFLVLVGSNCEFSFSGSYFPFLGGFSFVTNISGIFFVPGTKLFFWDEKPGI